MIFYFSGTGNSRHAAEFLAGLNGEIVEISKAVREGKFSYTVKNGESVGFVFPVYCGSVGDPIVEFVQKLELKNAGYVYAVITCGAGMGAAGGYLAKLLKARGITLDNAYQLVMPNNALIYSGIKKADECGEAIRSAENQLDQISSRINRKEKAQIKGSLKGTIFRKTYLMMLSTKKFYVTDKCTGCGKCQSVCPVGAISLKDGKPVWVKDKCAKCTGCINRCPVEAIQYGKATEKRSRYVYPGLK